MRSINKRLLLSFVFLLLPAFLIAGCGNDSNTEKADAAEQETEETQVEREELEVMFDQFEYEADRSELKAVFSSNLLTGTEVESVQILDENGTDVLAGEEFSTEEEVSTIHFKIEPEMKEKLVEGDYRLALSITVNDEQNSEYLTNEIIGGSFADMQTVYADSTTIKLSAGNQPNAYSVEIQSTNQLALPDEIFQAEEAEKVEEEKEGQESADEGTSDSEEANYKVINATDLKQRFDDLYGEKIVITGEVTQVIKDDPYAMSETSVSYLINVSDPNDYNADNSLWVEILDNAPSIFDGSIVTVKGTLLDPYTYDSVSAGRVTVPYVMAHSITPK
ncbi:MAG: hypothetical protein ACQEXB_09120 [Bacillota bacterium]